MRSDRRRTLRHGTARVRHGAAVAVAVATLLAAGTVAADAAAVPHGFTVTVLAHKGNDNNYFNGVSCTATTCVAVGLVTIGGVDRTLITTKRPHGWAIVSSPNAGPLRNLLSSVSCPTATFCMAVGWRNTGTSATTLAERFNGHGWYVSSGPAVAGTDAEFDSVSCTSATRCVAVGKQTPASASKTLVETYNGHGWRVVASPSAATGDSYLNAVSCPTPTWCTAAGFTHDTMYVPLAVASHGGAWTTVPTPNRGPTGSLFYGLSCASASFCRADGVTFTATAERPFIEGWNGHHWSWEPAPALTPTSTNSFLAMSCAPGTTSCEAVGDFFSGTWRNFVERTTGKGWSVVKVGNAPGGGNTLIGASCTTATSCVAAGQLELDSTSKGRLYVLTGH